MLDFLRFINRLYKENVNTRNAIFMLFLLTFLNVLIHVNNSDAFTYIMFLPMLSACVMLWVDILTDRLF